MSESKDLNPEIKTVKVGTRQLRPVKIYPLSVADQFELTKSLATVINQVAGEEVDLRKMSEEKAVEAIQEIVSSNLDMILKFVCDDGEAPKMTELTNNQIVEIVTTIFEVNYEGLIKNFKDLFKRGKVLFRKPVPGPSKTRRTR
jgi:hypothetical protein